jgi:hypothetical protein
MHGRIVIKTVPLIKELNRRPSFAAALIHVGQQFSPDTSTCSSTTLKMPRSDKYLGVGGGSPVEQTRWRCGRRNGHSANTLHIWSWKWMT